MIPFSVKGAFAMRRPILAILGALCLTGTITAASVSRFAMIQPGQNQPAKADEPAPYFVLDIVGPPVVAWPRARVDLDVYFINPTNADVLAYAGVNANVQLRVMVEGVDVPTRRLEDQRREFARLMMDRNQMGRYFARSIRKIQSIPLDLWFDLTLPGKYKVQLVEYGGTVVAETEFQVVTMQRMP